MEGRGRVLKMSPDVGLDWRPWRVRSIDIDRRRGWPVVTLICDSSPLAPPSNPYWIG